MFTVPCRCVYIDLGTDVAVLVEFCGAGEAFYAMLTVFFMLLPVWRLVE